MSLRKYVVSQDQKSKLWYCHQEGFSNVPCGDSFCEKKSEAREYAKMYNYLQHKVCKKVCKIKSERKKNRDDL